MPAWGLLFLTGCSAEPAPTADFAADAFVAQQDSPADTPDHDAEGSVEPSDAALDAGLDAAPDGPTDGPEPEPGPTRYPHESIVSPLTQAVAARLRDIHAANDHPNDRVFMKAGASGTVSHHLLYCFAGTPEYNLELDGRDSLLPGIAWFRAGDAAGTTPFDRATLAAEVGRTAAWCITGSPSPLEREILSIAPSFALVNYGTNDMQMGSTHRSALFPFYDNLSELLDRLLAKGIIPIVTGLNPRSDSLSAAHWVPTYNAVSRALAEARQIPYIDLYRAVVGLPNMGLVSDGLHGNAYFTGTYQPCVFTDAGLAFNYNVRNLLTMQILDAVRLLVLENHAAPDVAPAALQGSGTVAEPFLIDSLPFTHAFDTSGGASLFDAYPACDQGQNEGGPEVIYRLSLSEPTALRLGVLNRAGVDIDIHLLDPTASTCLARHDRMLELTLPAGTYHLALDSFVAQGQAKAGPYVLVVLACEPGDPDCAG